MAENGSEMVEMALKMVKNQEFYTGNFNNLSNFGISVSVKNVPNYSCFGYPLSRYIFPKKLEIPKLLLERITLVSIITFDLFK